jgi:outer membrane receptor protein involved in Fe transport
LTSDLDDRGLVDALSLFDATAGLESADGRWNLTMYVRNLTDEVYATGLINGAVPGLFGNRGSKIVRLGAPRTMGATVTVNFN